MGWRSFLQGTSSWTTWGRVSCRGEQASLEQEVPTRPNSPHSSFKFGVRVCSFETIFISDLIMPLFHFWPPFFLFGLCLVGLSLHLGRKPFRSKVGTIAAAEQADQQGDDDDSAQHGQSDNQRLKVHPAEAPTCVIQWTKWVRGENGADGVRYTRFCCDTPQTRHILQTFLTACCIQGLTCFVGRGSLSARGPQTEEQQQQQEENRETSA